jgi:RNA-directed DNA polymerase
MSMQQATRQMPGQPGRELNGQGEAMPENFSDEASCPRYESVNAGSALLEAALRSENLRLAFKRVRSNKGAAGVDGLDIDQTSRLLVTEWPSIRARLFAGTYRPSPVRRVTIPKPDGGERELGIPTVTDRLIQQALLQILQPLLDPAFSEHSYGFRPGRSAQQAVLAAQAYIQSGLRVVVDVDLAQFFDRVNHDILIDRLRKKINDPGVIRLIRAYLNSGIMDHGIVQARQEGTPQGGPLSPLLANVLLDEVDKKLEQRGHCFARYADDANVYVRSHRAGERVMAMLRDCYAKLRLQVNEGKSAVASAFGRKFLGYAFWVAPGKKVSCKVAAKPLAAYKRRIRALTRRIVGRSMRDVAAKLRTYVNGWKAYFNLAQTPKIWRDLDKWLRHRLRAVQLKQWRHSHVIYRQLIRLGALDRVARMVASKQLGWWRNSDRYLKYVLTIAHFDSLGVPRLT